MICMYFRADSYLNMPLDDKRLKYRCGEKYSTLADVLTWPEYFVKEEVEPIRGNKNKQIKVQFVKQVTLSISSLLFIVCVWNVTKRI